MCRHNGGVAADAAVTMLCTGHVVDIFQDIHFVDDEPNDLTEVNNSEVTPIFFQRRTSRASTYNSGEDTAATPVDSEVDDA